MKLTEEAGAVPTNVTAGIEGPKLPIKGNKEQNVFRRIQDIRNKKNLPVNADTTAKNHK